MNRLFHGFQSPGPLYAFAAVVDKLPDARSQSGDVLGSNDGAEASESEGISLLFAKLENVQGKKAPPRRIKGPEVEEPSLVFSVQTGSSHTAGDTAYRPVHEVGLRLANTIFVNGNENTMFGMRWSRDLTSGNLILDQSMNLSTCVITSTAETVQNSFELPLHPVGQRRRVVTSMGNILRQLTSSVDDTTSDPMPASSELEKELPRYISENEIDDPLVSVWGLIEKPNVKPAGVDIQERLTNSLREGGKLYRVMSGGGGWGKKQGLLSLDPDISLAEAAAKEDLIPLSNLFCGSTNAIQDLPPALDKRLIIDDLSLLSQAASAGDYVQFFVSVEPRNSQSSYSRLSSQQPSGLRYRFGVVYDVDDYGDYGRESADAMRQKDLALLPSYFGALSTKTITYLQPVIKPGLEEKLESGTKLDVPGSRVELRLA